MHMVCLCARLSLYVYACICVLLCTHCHHAYVCKCGGEEGIKASSRPNYADSAKMYLYKLEWIEGCTDDRADDVGHDTLRWLALSAATPSSSPATSVPVQP